MKILFVNKYFYVKGGAERYVFDLTNELKKLGHKIAFLATLDKKNKFSRFSNFFVKYDDPYKLGILDKIKRLPRLIYSFEARKKIRDLIKKEKPDIAHLNNIYYHLTPSIIDEIKKFNIPIVMTLHDYKIFCHNYYFFDFKKNKPCENCLKGNHYKCMCYKKGLAVNIAGKLETNFHKLRKSYSNVDFFIAPSKFMKKVYLKEGYDPKKIAYLPNFISLESSNTKKIRKEDYAVYFARISFEKGIFTLLNSSKLLPKIHFKIIGDGPEFKNLKDEIRKNKIKNVELLGFKSGKELKNLISKARFSIAPSLWHENCPYSILESYSLGTPVIASNIGGIPEIIINKKTGLLFKPGDYKDLKNKIEYLYANKELQYSFLRVSRKIIKNKFNKEKYLTELLNLYKKLINKNE